MQTIWACGAVDQLQDIEGKKYVACKAQGCGVVLHGGWHATRALAHCAKIKGEGVAACHGTFGNETKAALEFLRADHLRKKAQCSPNKFAEGESTSQLRNQTAARVENDAPHYFTIFPATLRCLWGRRMPGSIEVLRQRCRRAKLG